MLRHRGFMAVVATVVILAFMSSTQFAYAADASRILGDVVGNGKAEMMSSLNSWISISGKSFPVVDGSHLRSQDGRMSIILKDGVRVEASSKSELTVTGLKADYKIILTTGSLGFSVAQGARLSVQTPTATVKVPVAASAVQKVSVSKESVKGFVTFDGKGTKVVAVSGDLIVHDSARVAAHTLSQGNTLYIAATGGAKITPVQAPGNEQGSAGVRQMRIEDETDRPGCNYFNTQTPDAKACETLCRKDSRCAAFTFFQGACWLKDSLCEAKPLPGATSGVYADLVPVIWWPGALLGAGVLGTALVLGWKDNDNNGQPASPFVP